MSEYADTYTLIYDVILLKMKFMVVMKNLQRLLQMPMNLRMNLGKSFSFFPGARRGRTVLRKAEAEKDLFKGEKKQMRRKRATKWQLPFKGHKGWCYSDADSIA
jgi:hypothetical protein